MTDSELSLIFSPVANELARELGEPSLNYTLARDVAFDRFRTRCNAAQERHGHRSDFTELFPKEATVIARLELLECLAATVNVVGTSAD